MLFLRVSFRYTPKLRLVRHLVFLFDRSDHEVSELPVQSKGLDIFTEELHSSFVRCGMANARSLQFHFRRMAPASPTQRIHRHYAPGQ